MYIDKRNMKKMSIVWREITNIAYSKDMNKCRWELFDALESFGEFMRQAVSDNEKATEKAVSTITEKRKTNKNYARGLKNERLPVQKASRNSAD